MRLNKGICFVFFTSKKNTLHLYVYQMYMIPFYNCHQFSLVPTVIFTLILSLSHWCFLCIFFFMILYFTIFKLWNDGTITGNSCSVARAHKYRFTVSLTFSLHANPGIGLMGSDSPPLRFPPEHLPFFACSKPQDLVSMTVVFLR